MKYFITAHVSTSYEVMIEAEDEDHAEELFDQLDLEHMSKGYESVDFLHVEEAHTMSEKLRRNVPTLTP